MNYSQCLNYLDHIQALGIKFGLDNVRTVLKELNNPQKQFLTIQVAGSNGKGSVCAMFTQILTLHKIRCGLFTSPHLVEVEERIRIGMDIIPRKEFCSLLTLLKEVIQKLIKRKELKTSPTYFEIMTLLALLYFKEKVVDMAVLEVGMGGRFDATTVVDPVITAITTISDEHQEYLGRSLAEIAFEKAGIIKPRVPVISGVINEEAKRTIIDRACELEAPFIDVFGENTGFSEKRMDDKYLFEYTLNGDTYEYSSFLPGSHQGKNAAVAINIADQISKKYQRLEKNKITKGIESTKWEGRLEIISKRPLIIMDGAHNIEGAKALRKYVDEFIGSLSILIFAVMREKKIKEISHILFPTAEKVILTLFPFHKSASPQEILSQTPDFRDKISCESDPEQDLSTAVRSVYNKGSILIAGSLYIVGEMKKIIKANHSLFSP
ncbi:MAG TPA: folylpolyglutamate synthase/dihydrofolate synthase family protein [Acidobacteriota bacterium]|nr:folylpolyglutamate synthase/dihydrofolate synthase family protein [Acidobacteriota bacterium]